MECINSKNILGCVGMQRNDFCILNMQYTPEDYVRVATQIIEDMMKRGEWGEYLHPQLSFFSYHETVAHEYFPLTKDEALLKGFRWRDEVPHRIDAPLVAAVPETIQEVSDEITKRAIPCELTGKPFKITPYELQIYRALGIPLPRICPDERHKARVAKTNPPKLWKRRCAESGEEIITAVPPTSYKRVVSNEVYLSLQR
jgi:hypothetical protein